MHARVGRRSLAVTVLAALLGTACGSGGDAGPSQSPPVIAKAPTKSGDLQTGPAGEALLSDLRVIVTRDGNPASDETVTWGTGSGGSLNPTSDKTDADGISTSTWTLGSGSGTQTATASLPGATGTPVTFAATATGGGPSGVVIQVLGPAGGNRFSPTSVTVVEGSTVTWQWPDGVLSHNVLPDDGSTPMTSGQVSNGPKTYAYTFNTAGVYHYHCFSHGTAGGLGMSGTVTVVTALP